MKKHEGDLDSMLSGTSPEQDSTPVALAIEAAALSEWQNIRGKFSWIPDTEDVRGAFVVGFARGTHYGMGVNIKGIAEELLRGHDEPPRCPKCGYTYEDCQTHMDHHLCGEPTPPRATGLELSAGSNDSIGKNKP